MQYRTINPMAAVPFSSRFGLHHFTFHGGLSAAYASAPGGAFGKVLIGNYGGISVAVKLLLERGTAKESFHSESDMLLLLRGKIDATRELEDHGVPLSLADRGAHHIAYVYGVGDEPDLSALDPHLPKEKAFIVVVEPLARTLEEVLLQTPAASVHDLLRAANGVALGLAFLAKHGVVVCWHGYNVQPIGSCSCHRTILCSIQT